MIVDLAYLKFHKLRNNKHIDAARRSNENLCLHFATAKNVFHFQLNKQKLAGVCMCARMCGNVSKIIKINKINSSNELTWRQRC